MIKTVIAILTVQSVKRFCKIEDGVITQGFKVTNHELEQMQPQEIIDFYKKKNGFGLFGKHTLRTMKAKETDEFNSMLEDLKNEYSELKA